MPNDLIKPFSAVILTALPVEYQAIREHLSELREDLHLKGTIYERGIFIANGKVWQIGIAQVGAGNARTASEVERAINHFHSGLAFFVGVAGGLKSVQLGDVIAATKVYGYESGKASIKVLTRPEVGNSSYILQQRAQSVINRQEWQERIKEKRANQRPNASTGAIAAGEKVITSMDSPEVKLLKSTYEDALAVEMEGYGFLNAIHANPGVDAMVIRGISDLIDNKSEADANNWQQIASRHASAFLFEVIAKLGGGPSRRAQNKSEAPDKPKRLSKSTSPASKFNIQNKGNVNQQNIGDHLHVNYNNYSEET